MKKQAGTPSGPAAVELSVGHRAVIERAKELGVSWHTGEPPAETRVGIGGSQSVIWTTRGRGTLRAQEDIRRDIREVLKRGVPPRPRGHYLRLSLTSPTLGHSGEMTLYAGRKDDGVWRVGWSWRNPKDQPSAKRGRVEARKRAVAWMLSGREDPPWQEIAETFAHGIVNGDIVAPSWTTEGGFEGRLRCAWDVFFGVLGAAAEVRRKVRGVTL